MTETTTASASWPLLIARLRHLLGVEGYGSASNRYPGNVPVAARANTGRHLLALGSEVLDRLVRDWPEVERLPIWPDLRRVIMEGDDAGPSPLAIATTFEEPLLDPRSDDPHAVTRQLIRRLVYLHDEEFSGMPLGLLTISKAWLGLRAVVALDAHLLEAYLDSTDTTARRMIRFCLRDLGLVVDWEHASDAELFRSIAERMDRYPLTLAGASPAQIERFKRAGMLRMSFRLDCASPMGAESSTELYESPGKPETQSTQYALCNGRFIIQGPFPGSQGIALDLGVDRESGKQILITKLFVLDYEPLPRETELSLRHDGIAALLYLARVELPIGLANVLVEALPDAARSDAHLPLPLPLALQIADRVATILEAVHASGACVLGLRPELTFVDALGHVTLVPRGDQLRKLTWPEGPKVEGQEPPFCELYLAPEVLMGSGGTSASDVYSLCAMLTYWIRAVHPYSRDSAMAQLRAMLTEAPDCRGLPDSLAVVIARGLSPDPGRRPTLPELRHSFRND